MNKKLKQHQTIIPGHSIGSSVVGKDINFALRNWKRKLKDFRDLQLLEKEIFQRKLQTQICWKMKLLKIKTSLIKSIQLWIVVRMMPQKK